MSFNPPPAGSTATDMTPEEYKELERMVTAFRIQELKSLLTFASQPSHGRKTEMVDRALRLVRTTKNQLTKNKVRQLYWQLYDRDRSLLEANYSNPGIPNGMSNTVASPYGIYGSNISVTVPSNSAAAASNRIVSTMATTLVQCAARQNIELHPNLKLTHLPFYDVIFEVMKPTTLVPLSGGKFQDNHVTFTLTREQLNMITYNDKAPLPRIQLQLRFALLNLTAEQKDEFPSGCVLRMNDRVVQIPNPIPTNKVGVEPKRPSRPVDVTSHIIRAGHGSNDQRIHISWHHDGSRFWTVSVYVVRHLTTKILMDRVKNKGERPEGHSVQMIKDKLGDDECDRDIAATSLRVSLLCPLGKIRMRLPCRLRSCKHLQCFDLELFLQMNEKKPTWTCPVCDAPTMPFSDLQIDGYFTNLMTRTTSDESEVELYVGGGFKAISDNDTIDLDSDEPKTSHKDNRQPVQMPKAIPETGTSSTSVPKAPIPPSNTSNDDCLIIDLISDDEDDRSPAPSTSVTRGTTGNGGRFELETVSNSSSSSPSIIVLDSPSPRMPSTPEDPKSNGMAPPHRFKRSHDAGVGGNGSPTKRFGVETEASASADSAAASGQRLRDTLFFQQLLDLADITLPSTSYPLPSSYAPVPVPPPTTLAEAILNWRPPTPLSTVGATSGGGPISTSTPSLSANLNLNQEFEAFLKSCLPPSPQ